MPDLDALLEEFAEVADPWFEERTSVEENYAFIQDFFDPNHLRSAEWEAFQELGNQIHALNSMPVAKERAFGNQNHSIEHYRRSFEYLAHGQETLPDRLNRLMNDPDLSIDYVKGSTLGELAGWLFAEDYQMRNQRALAAAEAIGIEPETESGDSLGEKVRAFTEATAPVGEPYQEVVGSRTELPIRLEVDQFFNWIYQERGELFEGESSSEDEVRQDSPRIWLLQPGRGGTFWDYWKDRDIITIGWDELGDLREYADRSDIENRLSKNSDRSSEPKNAGKACLEFRDEMKEAIVRAG